MGHILITGPGRSGTTFLVQLLTRMGCDTGFMPYKEPYHENIRAGCERGDIYIDMDSTIAEARAYMDTVPKVFKAPDWAWLMKGYLIKGYVTMDHVILPFRDFEEAAKSRLAAGLDWMIGETLTDYDDKLGAQTAIHAMVFGYAMEACYLFRIPLTIMRFPDFIQSVDYCYQRLSAAFDLDYDLFKEKHKELARV